jgi:2-hydroxy-4-carboxymuconate semialdehyde hemiacetal dehydrogenase
MPGVEVRVWGPDWTRTSAFARRHGVVPVRRRHDHLEALDGVVIASPSSLHEAQAIAAVRAGVAVLVEVPACPSAGAGQRLARLASERGSLIEAAHTVRFLDPFRVVGAAVMDGQIGEVQRVTYRRELQPPTRTWVDDALYHHAQHAIDLLIGWFGHLTPIAGHLTPAIGPVGGAHARLMLHAGAEASIDVRYRTGPQSTTLRVEGSTGWLETDGFTMVRRSHGPERHWDGDEVYLDAIRRQDEAFVAACAAACSVGEGWTQMIEATAVIDQLAAISSRGDG